MNSKIPVTAIVGPTASGKTGLAVELAKLTDAEIVSADSMQIYKGMSVATAKPTEEEMQGVRHHMIDYVDVSEQYSVARYVSDAKECIEDIYSRGRNIIVCGGTGLYVDSLLGNMGFEFESAPGKENVREALRARAEKMSSEELYSELAGIDPSYAANVHPNNRVRVLRALEIYELTGEIPSVYRKNQINEDTPFNPVYIGLDFRDRGLLYKRIDARVDGMLAGGLVKEAEKYFALDNKTTASQAIGYKELKPWFDGKLSLDEAVENLKKATRHYAKRQLTWFRRNPELNILYADGLSSAQLASSAYETVKERLCLTD